MLLGSDVVLDTFPFGGGVSNLEALAVGMLSCLFPLCLRWYLTMLFNVTPEGTPVVTHPDMYLRGRLTLSFYRTMGLGSRFVRYSLQEYVMLAVKLASNSQLEKQRVRHQILDAKGKVFRSTLAIEEWERFLYMPVMDCYLVTSTKLWKSIYVPPNGLFKFDSLFFTTHYLCNRCIKT